MSMAGSFLGGARDRLLPVSIPFRFFLTAAGFHVLAWVMLLLGAAELPGFAGGTGLVLGAIHLLTLGVLALTGMGASYQLLPVVTRRPLARTWPARLSFWLMVPGIIVLAYGMATTAQAALSTGAGLVSAGMAVFALLTADNLRRAGSMPVVAAHGWGALAALVGLVAIALALIGNIGAGYLDDPAALALAHMILASFGFMGLLVLGLSLVLIPMFVLSHSLPQAPGWVQLGLASLALVLFTAAVLADIPALALVAVIPACGAGFAYFLLMRAAFTTSMRKRLGLSFLMIRSSWAWLGLCLILGLAILLDAPVPNAPALFGLVLLVGWLLTFLTGILQRIMPFLASMHGSGRAGLPMLLSDLTAETPLRVHAACHHLALVLCGVGIVADWPALVTSARPKATIPMLCQMTGCRCDPCATTTCARSYRSTRPPPTRTEATISNASCTKACTKAACACHWWPSLRNFRSASSWRGSIWASSAIPAPRPRWTCSALIPVIRVRALAAR